jgi:6-phosphogluconolactonase
MLTYNTYELLSHALAHTFVWESNKAINNHGTFYVAISGGNTPRLFLQLLATPAYSNNINWKKIQLFFVDERYVPYSNADSNYGMAKNVLLSQIKMPQKNVHAMPVGTTPVADAKTYELTIKTVFDSKKPVFDLIILGLGNDGHTASLFPETEILHETKKLIKEVFVPAKNSYRISFTYPLINAARCKVFLVSGAEKTAVLKKISGPKKNNLPASLIFNNVVIMADDAAVCG